MFTIKKWLISFLCYVYISFTFAEPPYISERKILHSPPKIIRTCCSFGSISVIGVPFFKKSDIICKDDLGLHEFLSGKDEGNGIVYTKRGGFIDIGHLRDCADWTAYVYNLIKYNQTNNEWRTLNLGYEGGVKKLTFTNTEAINDENIYELSGKIAFNISLWHEIATWFGASYVPLVPERFSSFSPEDVYSNLLGVKLGIKALKSDLPYNEAMTNIINETLDTLEVVSNIDETYMAMKKIQYIWWTDEKKLPSKNVLLKRHYGIGDAITPWLVPDLKTKKTPYILQKPAKELSDLFEFSINLNFRFPSKTLNENETGRVVTQKDFDRIIDFIVEQIQTESNKKQKSR